MPPGQRPELPAMVFYLLCASRGLLLACRPRGSRGAALSQVGLALAILLRLLRSLLELAADPVSTPSFPLFCRLNAGRSPHGGVISS